MNPFLIQEIKGTFDAANKRLVIVMERITHGSLEHLLQDAIDKNYRIKEEVIWTILAQVIYAMAFLNSLEIKHRDLKPENILMNGPSGPFKVGLFSEVTSDENSTTSFEFRSPEDLQNLDTIDERSDVWSLGITIYKLMHKEFPFPTNNHHAFMDFL